MYNAIRRAQADGAKLIVLDPRRSENADVADIWLPRKPGSDAAMCFGWLKVIFDEGLYEREFVERWTTGFEDLRSRVDKFPLERVQRLTVLNAEDIASAARETVHTADGPLRIEVPRDREGSFEPVLIPKLERRFTGFDDKIVALYARGMTVREIQGFLAEQYGTEVSPEFISSVTDAFMAEVSAWQGRPLEPMYPVVFFDALRVKIKEEAVVRNKAVYLALGVLPDGTRDILGLWIENKEGAKFWMKVFNENKTRRVEDVLIAVTDGLKGIPEALAAV